MTKGWVLGAKLHDPSPTAGVLVTVGLGDTVMVDVKLGVKVSVLAPRGAVKPTNTSGTKKESSRFRVDP